jgi:hypothetical protein
VDCGSRPDQGDPISKENAAEMAQGVGLDFKPCTTKNNNNKFPQKRV